MTMLLRLISHELLISTKVLSMPHCLAVYLTMLLDAYGTNGTCYLYLWDCQNALDFLPSLWVFHVPIGCVSVLQTMECCSWMIYTHIGICQQHPLLYSL